MQVTVADMMAAREARAQVQQALLARYPGAAVICLTMNVAGPVKTDAQIERAFEWGKAGALAVLAPQKRLFTAEIHEATGPEAVFAVAGDARELKRRLCALEDGCAMGRLLDIDVLFGPGEKVSRGDIGLPPRRCLICGEPAAVCARSRTHSAQQLFARTQEIIRAHFEDAFVRSVAENAERALLTEAALAPKPGLVDRLNPGAHRDMDLFTFIDSACALRPYFEACAREGLTRRGGNEAACFDALRTPGLLAEARMRGATGGVNTHKGAVFSMGVLCAALGMGYDGEGSDPEAALLRCGRMTCARMEQELAAAAQGAGDSCGERLWRTSGIGGVRTEAAAGFPSVREAALPRLRACLTAGMGMQDAALCALVALMARAEDTNAVRRGGAEGARRLRERAAAEDAALSARLAVPGFDAQTEGEALRFRLTRWDAELSAAGISPGGCADMLALTLMAHYMEEKPA